jgi:hypothetical protein
MKTTNTTLLLLAAALVALIVAAAGAGAAPATREVREASAPAGGCTDEQVNQAVQAHRDCGATLRGPGSLPLHPCPANLNEPGGLCTAEFTLSLSVAGGNLCSASAAKFDSTCFQPGNVTLAPAFTTAAGKPVQGPLILPGDWCQPGVECDNGRSQPMRVVIPSSARPPKSFRMSISLFGEVSTNPGPHFTATFATTIGKGQVPPEASLKVALIAPKPESSAAGTIVHNGKEITPNLIEGEESTVTLRVTAHGGDFTDVGIRGGGVKSCRPRSVKAYKPPPLAFGFPLDAGQSRTFEIKILGVDWGSSSLRVAVRGRTKSGTTVDDSAVTEIQVGPGGKRHEATPVEETSSDFCTASESGSE